MGIENADLTNANNKDEISGGDQNANERDPLSSG